MSHFTVYFSDH